MREATVYLSIDQLEALGIEPFVTSVREAGLERICELQCRRPGCLIVVEVAEAISRQRFSSIPNLDWWEEVASSGHPTYLCKLAVPALRDEIAPRHQSEATQSERSETREGIVITLIGDQDALSDRFEEFSEVGTDPLLRALTDYSEHQDPLEALTTRQREVLMSAFELGYYDIPREVTTHDIATEEGIGASTVREHLQRAQRNLLTSLLGAA